MSRASIRCLPRTCVPGLLPGLLLVLWLALLPPPLLAQGAGQDGPALLVADSVFVENGDRLVASGNVEALNGDTRVQASRIVYDRGADRLLIDAPIRITDAEGTIILADAAELDEGLRNGLLTGARIVLDQQLQMAAVEARRVDGRYTQLSRVAVTSCQVCGPDEVPLWHIRASRVVHDQEARQLYFDDAQLRVLDVPVLYVPRLRIPDPTLKRARGFLIPTLRSNTLLGFGIKLPYFIPLGDHRDITLTPYLSPKTRTLELRYRQAFARGDLQVLGALSSDTLQNGKMRGYVFADGAFALRNDYRLSFDLKTVTDSSYLNDYGYPGGDRLDSDVTVSRVRRDTLFRTTFIHYQSLRADEDNDTQPALVTDTGFERRFFPAALAGEVRLRAEAHGHYRYSSRATDGPDADSVADGRDVARLNAELSWRNRWTLPGGVRAGLSSHLWLDHYATWQDSTSAREVSAATPGAAAELRWPLLRHGSRGGRTLLEPVLQYGWVGGSRGGNPNDESTRVEFDEGNLLSLSRFPAEDRRERGQTLAAGLRWLHMAPGGWSAALTLGRVWRDTADADLSRSSGLDGTASDWLIAGRFAHPDGLTLSARGLLDDDARFSKAEARADWSNDRMDLGASYVLLVTDPAEDRTKAQSEWTFDGSYQVSPNWTTSALARYDLADQRLDRVGLGLQYRNECVQVDFGATRNLASARNLQPSTDFDLTVALKGFGTGGSAKEYRRTCKN